MVSSRLLTRRVLPVFLFLVCVILLSRYLPGEQREITPKVLGSVKEESNPKKVPGSPPDRQVAIWEEHVGRDIRNAGERDNFVCIMCASQPVAVVLRRYAFTRRLNVMLPRDNNIYLGWPYLLNEVDYRPSVDKFNCLIEPAVYNRTIMKPLFPSDTQFITIIRDPWSHFKSTFHDLQVDKILGIKAEDPLVEYLRNVGIYDAIYKHHNSNPHRYCIPDGFSVTKNLLSHYLGMPLGFPGDRDDISGNEVAVNSYISQLDKEFGLVMIMEYFDESMLFLKQLMKWSYKDIVYEKVNIFKYTHDSYPDSIKNKHKEWSPIDYIVYDHFQRKMESQIRNGGLAFQNELKKFKRILHTVNQFCKSVKQSLLLNSKITLKEFTFSGYECIFLSENLNHLYLLQRRSDADMTEKIKSYKRTC